LNQKLQKLSKQAEKRKRILSFWKKPKFWPSDLLGQTCVIL
jgi:hypothetical protein